MTRDDTRASFGPRAAGWDTRFGDPFVQAPLRTEGWELTDYDDGVERFLAVATRRTTPETR